MTKILTRRVLTLFIVPNLLYALVALSTDAQLLITLLNGALLALAVGVCVAYYPVVWLVLKDEAENDTADWLGLGVFCSWAAIVYARIFSMIWRAWGGDGDWMLNSDLVTYQLFLSISAAVFHLGAPGAIGNRRVPTVRWVKTGIYAAAGAFGALVVGYTFDMTR